MSAADTRPENRARGGSAVVMWVLLFASSLTVMSGATISPSLPAIQTEFSGVADADLLVSLVLTVPALFIAIFAPVAGVLIDRIGRKPVLLASVALYGVAGGSGLILDDLYAILAGRALLGVAVAGVMTTATALIADYYSGESRSKVLGFQAAFMGFGGVVFLSFGGLLAEVGWRGPFAIYLLALILAPLVLFVLPEPARTSGPGQTEASEDSDGSGDNDPAGEPRERAPWAMLSLVYGLALVGMIVFYTVPTQLPFYLTTLTGAGPTVSGLAIALSTLAGALVSLNYRRVSARLGYGSVAALTFALLAAGYGAIGLAGGYPLVLVGLAVGGAGMGILMPNVNTWVSSCTPEDLRGRALGGVTTFIFLGQFLSPIASQPVGGALGFGTAYLLAGGLALAVAAFVIALVASDTRKRRLEQEVKAPTESGAPAEAAAAGTRGIFC